MSRRNDTHTEDQRTKQRRAMLSLSPRERRFIFAGQIVRVAIVAAIATVVAYALWQSS